MVKGCGSDSPASGARRKANCPGCQRIARPLGASVTMVVSPCRVTALTVNSRRRRRGATNSVCSQATIPARPKLFSITDSDGSTPVGRSTKNWWNTMTANSRPMNWWLNRQI